MAEFRHTRLISEYDSVTGKFINYLELGDTSTDPDTPVDLRFRVPGYIENVHTIYFEGDHGDSPEAGISTSKPSGIVHDLVFFDPQNTAGKTLSELVTGSGGESLWKSSAGETSLITPEPINMGGKNLDRIGELHANDGNGIDIYNSAGNSRGTIATTTYALQCLNGGIHMNGQTIVMLGAGGAGTSSAARMSDLDSYLPLTAGSTKALSGDLYIGGKDIIEIKDLYGRPGDWDFEFYGGTGTDAVTEIMRWDASEQNLSMAGNKIANLGGITMVKGDHLGFGDSNIAYIYQDATTNDLKFYDTALNAEKTLSQLASGSGSSAFTGLSDTPPNYTDHAGEFVKVKSDLSGLEFVVGSGGESLWESPASVTYLTTPEDINIAGYSITNLSAINATDTPVQETGDYDELFIRSQSGSFNISKFVALSDDSGGYLDMLNHHIANVLDGDDVKHAVNMGQLGYVDSSGWVAGDLLYASGSNTLVRLAKGNDAQVLTLGSGVPTWADPSGSGFTCVNLNSCHVTDLTDVSSAGSHSIITDAERTKLNGIDTSLYMLLSVYDPGSDGVVIPTAGGTGLGSGLNAYETGDILYASAADTLGRLVHGEENQVLTMNSSLLPVWATPSGGTGLWQDMGTYVQLIQSDNDLSMRNKSILSCPSVKVDGTDSYIDIRGGSAYPARVIAYGEDHAWSGDVRLYVPNAAKNDWLVGLIVDGATDTPYVGIPYGLNMSGPIDLGGQTATEVSVVQANDGNGLQCKASTGTNMLDIATSSYSFVANVNANMNTHDIINIGTLKGVSTHDLKFYDDVLCTDGNPVTLSQLANGGLWEEVNTSTIRPKTGYTTIQGIDSNDLYIKPASGKILYLG